MAQDLLDFWEQRQEAAESYVNGDFRPLKEILPRSGAATFHSPRGDTVIGMNEVARRYEQDAESFRPGSRTDLEVLQSAETGELAFWTGFQNADVRMPNANAPKAIRIRVTEVFRREADGWKLVHRHADMPPPGEQA